MAKVSLRNYIREIESLIEKGHTDEAIAHCRHILQTFPKHLESYRLLGKAYLESRRYTEAIDIFGRVLMCVPDDFVSHVGLSIIRDEESKLAEAIWHMERASESQPSNAAIQGELQRLYGRRDGAEPPKIRMTRGALAHMYVQGELYPQAISEIRAVLAQDPERTDMQVLLAAAFFKSGQKSAASDLCNQLLKDFPYCFDVNRIMVDLLPAIGGVSENTQVHRMRVSELDPYAAFANGSIFQTDEVPDASVTLERLDVSSDEFSAGLAWSASSAIGSDFSAVPALGEPPLDNQPDWLKSAIIADEMSHASPPPADDSSAHGAFSAEAKDDIPDFLRDAGWAESKTPEGPSSIFDEDPSEKLVPADIPDWLKGQAPISNELSQLSQTRTENVKPVETPKWATGELRRPRIAESTDAQPAGDALDRLSSFSGGQALDDSAKPDSLRDWSGGAEDTKPSGRGDDVPEWLRDLETKDESVSSNANLGALAYEQDDAVAWLESLSAKPGTKPEEPVTEPDSGHEKPQEWAEQAQNISHQVPANYPSAQELGTSAQEQDDAVAWLESLAAKHGAKPEELLTDPGQRSETPPAWVQQSQSMGESQPNASQEPVKSNWVEGAQNIGEEFFAEFEKASTSTPKSDETGMWLRSLDQREKQEEQLEHEEPQGRDKPEWLSGAQQAGEPSAISEQKSFAEQDLSNPDLSSWLSSLDDEPGLDFDPEMIRASARPPVPDISEKQAGKQTAIFYQPGKPDDQDAKQLIEDESWKQPSASRLTEEPAAATLKAELPDWLQSEDETIGSSQQAGDDDAAPWSHREQWEAEVAPQEEPRPTSPSDWQPLEEKTVEAPKPKPVVYPPPPMAKPHSAPSRRNPTMKFTFSPEPIEPIRASSAKKKSGASISQSKVEGPANVDMLNQAKGNLDRGDIPAALDHYKKLIKKGKHLEETIRDLNESIYRYPVEVSIWQTLGDAYMRANRLMEALESYNKAEELIR
ncbi:MAG: tetratricopeptide repeat protein [Anaerolineales bacterium]|nr:tetratricopeptide repeat protein [Anaerolineales bacterium]